MFSNKAKEFLQNIPEWSSDRTNEIPDSFLCFVLYSSFYDDFCSHRYELENNEIYKKEFTKYFVEYDYIINADSLCISEMKKVLNKTYKIIENTVITALDIFFIFKLDINNFFPIVNGALFDAFRDFFVIEEEEAEDE